MDQMQAMTEQVALVTGGGSGLGHAAAIAFARRRARIAVVDLDENKAQSVAGAIVADGGEAIAIECDVRSLDAIKRAIAATHAKFGRLDCAFNNAGIGGPIVPMHEYPDEDWHNIISTNLTSIWHCMKLEIELMLEQGGGAIVNCASVTGMVGVPGMTGYCATKHAILGLTRAAALDYATRNIRINAVCPGTIHTPAVDSFLREHPETAGDFIAAIVKDQPIGRLGKPAEIGEAVAWLCSPEASFMLGQGLVVDGGYLAK